MDSTPTRILVVDDDESTVKLMAHLLTREGYLVSTATTIFDAKRLCEQHRFDLLITDLSLPDGDGMELLTQIKELCPARGIIVSGHDRESDEFLNVGEGFSEYLVKPIKFDHLTKTVKRVLAT